MDDKIILLLQSINDKLDLIINLSNPKNNAVNLFACFFAENVGVPFNCSQLRKLKYVNDNDFKQFFYLHFNDIDKLLYDKNLHLIKSKGKGFTKYLTCIHL